MGSGKTHWGSLWAEKYGLEFLDLDQEIERKEQKSITEIFEKKGEDIFRLIETKVLRDTIRLENCIVSCGGGTPCFHDNLQWMNEKGITVYLNADAHYLAENIAGEKDQRPLLKMVNEAELLFYTEQKLRQRLPFYEKATIVLNAKELTEDTFDQVLKVAIK